MIHAASASAATDARIPVEIEETLARQRDLSARFNAFWQRADLAQRTTLENIPLRGPVLALLQAADRRHWRMTGRIATIMLRHTRREMRRIDPALDAFLEQAQMPTSDPDLPDPDARKARVDEIMDALDRFDASILEARGRAETQTQVQAQVQTQVQTHVQTHFQAHVQGPPEPEADTSGTAAVAGRTAKILQNELGSVPLSRCAADQADVADTVRDVRSSVPCDPGPVGPAQRPERPPPPVRRGVGTLDDPLIQPVARSLRMDGLAPGRVPTVYIDTRSPPLVGLSREDWLRQQMSGRPLWRRQ
jgi:hypothetical protein